MARKLRVDTGGLVFHVMNRATEGTALFDEDWQYDEFEQLLRAAVRRFEMRMLAHCLMPNHWHVLLWPQRDGDMPRFTRWVTQVHAQWRRRCGDSIGRGAVYQSRYRSVVVQPDGHLIAAARYVERNALRSGLVNRAEEWRWGSLTHWLEQDFFALTTLAAWPVPRPPGWSGIVNRPANDSERLALRRAIETGRPFASTEWLHEQPDLVDQLPAISTGSMSSAGVKPKILP